MESFAEFDHLHQTDAYHSSLGVVRVLHTVDEASAQSHDVLDSQTNGFKRSTMTFTPGS